jgi:hypothetical protein
MARLLHIEYHKNALKGRIGNERYATPLANEVECLAKSLVPPGRLQTGSTSAGGEGTETTVTVPEGTIVKLVLRDPIYSKELRKGKTPPAIMFEVAEDVLVDGAAAFRRGASGTGQFLEIKNPRGYKRHAEIEFEIENATAVDGSTVKLSGAADKSRGGRSDEVLQTVLFTSPAFGWVVKGKAMRRWCVQGQRTRQP